MKPVRALVLPLAAILLTACGSMYRHGDKPMHGMHAPATTRDGVLVDSAGMTLYTFDRDPADATKSACNGPCAANWPPLAAGADDKASGDWKPVMRDDGSHQWAYKGKPLYRWVKDTKPGDRSGDGFNGVWRLARP